MCSNTYNQDSQVLNQKQKARRKVRKVDRLVDQEKRFKIGQVCSVLSLTLMITVLIQRVNKGKAELKMSGIDSTQTPLRQSNK